MEMRRGDAAAGTRGHSVEMRRGDAATATCRASGSQRRRRRVIHSRRVERTQAARLGRALAALEPGQLYVNHAGHLPNAEAAWINVVREPAARLRSEFHYLVDERRRAFPERVAAEKSRRAADATCGCADLSFADCVRSRAANGCPQLVSLETPLQFEFFCVPREPCTRGRGVNQSGQRCRCGDNSMETGRGTAAAATCLFHGNKSRRRRGRDADDPRRPRRPQVPRPTPSQRSTPTSWSV